MPGMHPKEGTRYWVLCSWVQLVAWEPGGAAHHLGQASFPVPEVYKQMEPRKSHELQRLPGHRNTVNQAGTIL